MTYAGTVIAFPAVQPKSHLTYFIRDELTTILDMYGRLVSTGVIRDYAIQEDRDSVSFSFFRKTSERPTYMVVKTPHLKRKQSLYRLLGPGGQVLKRGDNLKAILRTFEPMLLKLVRE